MTVATASLKSQSFERANLSSQRFVGIQHSIIILCTVILWNFSVLEINFRQINDFGLVSVLTPANYISLLLLTASFVVALHNRKIIPWIMILHLAALVYMLYGITTLVEEAPRFGPAWKHVGVTEYILRKGSLDPTIDAYFSWPGFFALSAFITEIAGFTSPLVFLAWAPVYFNLLYLGPLFILFNTATKDQRVIWLSIWLFYITNWIGQDYFAPQAFGFFLFLVIWGLLLRWFQNPITHDNAPSLVERTLRFWPRHLVALYTWLQATPAPQTKSTPAQRLGIASLVILLFCVMVASHQLTPFALLAGVSLLVFFNRCSLRGLPFLMALILILWLNYMAAAFIAGHLDMVIGQVGQVTNTVSANITDRLNGSPGHRFVVNMRLVMTLCIWGLAFLGWLRRVRTKQRDLSFMVGAITPFFLLALQNYGGELIMRTYLYSLPFMVFFVAVIFYCQEPWGRAWHTSLIVCLTTICLLGGFFITRYGNERMDYFAQNEVDAMQYAYRIAPPNSLLASSSFNLPIKFHNYEQYFYTPLGNEILIGKAGEIINRMQYKKYADAYLILTRSQQAYLELFYGFTPEAWQMFINDLRNSKQLRVAYENPDAVVFTLKNNP